MGKDKNKKSEIVVHSIKYNLLMSMILKISNYLFPLLVYPYIARVFGASVYGNIAFVISVITYFITFSNLGIPTYGLRICAQYRNEREKLGMAVQELLVILIITTFLAGIVFFVCLSCFRKMSENVILFLILSMGIFLNNIGVEWFYQGLEQYDYITKRNIAFKVCGIFLIFWFVKDETDIYVYALFYLLVMYGANILNLLRLNKFITFTSLKKINISVHIKPVLVFWVFNLSTSIYTNLDTIMLGILSSAKEIGLYNAALNIRSILLGVIMAIGSVLLPRVSYYYKNGFVDNFWRIVKNALNIVLLIIIPLIVFLVTEAETIIFLFVGNEFSQALEPLRILLITVLFVAISNITGMQILIPLGKEKYVIYSTICGACIDFLVNFILIKNWASIGVAIGTLIAEILVTIVQLFFLRKEFSLFFNVKNLMKIVCAAFVATFVLLISKQFFDFNILISMIAMLTVFGGVYIMILLLLKEECLINMVKIIKNKG